MNKTIIEIPGLKEDFERIVGSAHRQFKGIERQHRRRKVIMWASLIVAAASLTVSVIKCLN